MSIWIAVSLLNKERLVQLAQASVESATVAEPAFTNVGFEYSAYYVMDTLGTVLFGGCALGTKQGARSISSVLVNVQSYALGAVLVKSVVVWLL